MRTSLLRLLALLGALVLAVAAFVVAASLDLGFWPLAVVALLTFLGTAWLLLRASGLTRGAVWRWLAAGGATYVAIAQLLVGRTPPRTLPEPHPSAEVRYWSLPSGARIAYVATGPRADSTRPPVVVLQDGPGMPLLPFLQALGARPYDFLARAGYGVYYYDQLGSGFSSRLDLTREPPYTVARHVADLEAIRQALGAPRVVLAATGWGATLATQYLVAHPDRVERLILESPGPLWAPAWPETINPSARARTTDVQASALAALERPPLRLVLGRMMADFSPRTAHRWIADWEGDQWWTRRTEEAMRLGQPSLTCKSDPAESGLPAPAGLGFFAYSYTSTDALSLPDPRPALRERPMETLILRGTCDYVSYEISAEYLHVMPGAHYVAIPAAGHFIWHEQPQMFAEVVQTFLKGEKLPLEAYVPRGGSR